MNCRDEALLFDCAGATLVGVLSRPAQPKPLGALILVGGPQTRIGSHRQFALLARSLAAAGIAALRFDFRGMGDSEGEPRDFEQLDEDIAAALAAFQKACPELRQFALWGLCDAASAALLYWHRQHDARLAGLALLNPWVRSQASLERALVRHYYRDRLRQPEFWRKLLNGGIPLRRVLGEALARLARVRAGTVDTPTPAAFQETMGAALRAFPGALLVVLSGADLTAHEFADWAADADWRQRPDLRWQVVEAADHTFSSAVWREQVERLTLDWIASLEPAP